MNEFLENLKPKDKVIVCSSSPMSNYYIATVERMTKTLIVLSNGERYRRKDGFSIDRNEWYFHYLKEADPEKITHIRREKEARLIASKLEKYKWREMSLDDLRRVFAALQKRS